MNHDYDKQAQRLDLVAKELESAAKHAKISANHIRNGEIPRFAAHALAVEGHIVMARSELNTIAVFHSSKAHIE